MISREVALDGKTYLRSVKKPQHRRAWQCGLRIVAAVDLFTRRAVKVPYLKPKAGGLDKRISKSSHANIVGLTLRWLDVVSAVCLDVAHRDEVSVVICVILDPGTGEELPWLAFSTKSNVEATYLKVSDDGHGDTRIVESLEQYVCGRAVHGINRVAQLAQQVEGLISKINPDVARVTNVVKQVAHRDQTAFLV